jgi:hypothetical protein
MPDAPARTCPVDGPTESSRSTVGIRLPTHTCRTSPRHGRALDAALLRPEVVTERGRFVGRQEPPAPAFAVPRYVVVGRHGARGAI